MQNTNCTKGTFPVSSTDSRKPNILRKRPALRTSNSVELKTNIPRERTEEAKLSSTDVTKTSNKTNNRRTNAKETKIITRVPNASQKIVLDSYFCDKYRKAQENSNCKISFTIPLTEVAKNQDLPTADENVSKLDTDFNGIPAGDVENMDNVELPIEVVFSGENNTITLNGLNREEVLIALESGHFGVGQVLVGEGADQIQYWFCPIINCNKLYNEKSDLHFHILTHFDVKPFKCNIDACLMEFVTEDLLKQHCDKFHVKHDDKPNGEEISPVDSYIVSTKNNDDGEPRNIIDAALASVGIIEEHLVSVQHSDGSRYWICSENNCDLQFKALHLLKSHILVHYDLRPFKCDYEGCTWGFRYSHKLKKHLKVHKADNKTSFACTHPGCMKAFSTKYNLSVHIKSHKTSGNVSCPARACTLFFSTRTDVETHLEEHTLDDAVHCCTSCGKRFWWSTALASHHARVHVNSPSESVCPWPSCGRKFAQPCQLRYHIRSHTGDKPYRCTYPSCDKAFSFSSKLSRHARQHSKVNEGRYVCRECCRAFVRPDNLKEHLLRHMAHNSHQCDYLGCDKKFSTERSLLAHKKKEHGTNISNKTEEIKITDNIPELRNSPSDFITMESCDDDLLYLRSARTHVPWSPDVTCDLQSSLLPHDSGLLLQQRSCDEKRGNPLVCGGLSLDNDGSAANAGLILETSESALSSLPELETDLLESAGDHMNSLLLQEELTDGMLYSTDDEAAYQVLLLNEDPTP